MANLDIALYLVSDLTAPAWSPAWLGRGIPGSEEAAIHMARELAARGHAVTVYANVGDMAGVYDGATWKSSAAYADDPPHDVIVAQNLEAFADDAPQRAAQGYLWMENNFPGLDLRPHMGRIRKLMPLTPFSRTLHPEIPDDRIFLTRNGILADEFRRAVPRNPEKIVYGSDYDRGLLHLLELWPFIREQVPEATLSIFYGWTIFDAKIARTNPAQAEAMTRYKMRVAFLMQQEGIRHLGRIGHDELAREYLSAGVWAYPCTFPESSCITAMKAQAGGAIPIVFPTAALADTVRHGIRIDGLDPATGAVLPGRLMKWATALVQMLTAPDEQDRIRAEMVPDSLAYFDWGRVAEEWIAEFAAAKAAA